MTSDPTGVFFFPMSRVCSTPARPGQPGDGVAASGQPPRPTPRALEHFGCDVRSIVVARPKIEKRDGVVLTERESAERECGAR